MPKQNPRDDKKKKKKLIIFPSDQKEHKDRSEASKKRRRVHGRFADEPGVLRESNKDAEYYENKRLQELSGRKEASSDDREEARQKLRDKRLLARQQKRDREAERNRRLATYTAGRDEEAQAKYLEDAKAEGKIIEALTSLGFKPEYVRDSEGRAKLGYYDPTGAEPTWVDVEGYISDYGRRRGLQDSIEKINRTKRDLEEATGPSLKEVEERTKRAEARLEGIRRGDIIPEGHASLLAIHDRDIKAKEASYRFALDDPETTRGDLLMLKQDIEIAKSQKEQTANQLKSERYEDIKKIEKQARIEVAAAKGATERYQKQAVELKDRHQKEIDRILADIKETSLDVPDIVVKNPNVLGPAEVQALRKVQEQERTIDEAHRPSGPPTFESPGDIYDASGHLGPGSGGNRKDPLKGWKNTYAFQREQKKRQVEGVRSGTDTRAYKVWGDYGVNKKRAPAQRADVVLGPNTEFVTATDQFDYVDSRDKTRGASLEFVIRNPPVHALNAEYLAHQPGVPLIPEQSQGKYLKYIPGAVDTEGNIKTRQMTFSDLGIEETDAPTLEAAAKKAGISGGYDVEVDDTGHTFKLVLPQGNALNPDQIAHFTNILREQYGLEEHADGTPAISYEGPDLERRYIKTPWGASKTVGLEESRALDTWTEDVTNKKREVRLARRDEKGNLKKGDSDTLLIQTPGFLQYKDRRLLDPRLLTVNLQERSDAVGFGRSYRPGEQEINKLVTAVPREKKRREVEAALVKANEGDSEDLLNILQEDNPRASDAKLEHLRDELIIAGDAGAAATLYAGTRTFQRKVATKVLEDTSVGKWVDKRASISSAPWFHDFKNSLGRDSLSWYEEKKWMAKHPLSDPNLQIGGVEWNPHRYRTHFIHPDRAEARQLERTTRQIQAKIRAKDSVISALDYDPGRNPVKRLDKKIRLRQGHLVGGEHYTSGHLVDEIDQQIALNQEKAIPAGGMRGHTITSRQAQRNVRTLRALKEEHFPETVWGERLGTAFSAHPDVPENFVAETTKMYHNTNILPEGMPKKIGKGGLYGLGAAAVVGGGIFAYDKYKEHKIEESGGEYQSIGSKIARPLPRNVYKPQVKVTPKRTKPIKHTYFTDAVDLEGKRVVKGVKVKAGFKKTPLRPTDRKDIGGDTYKDGPLVGTPSIKLRTKPGEGSLLFEKDLRGAKGTTTLVKGPVYLQVGKKRRFGDTRANRLRTANPNKLTAQERDIAAMDYLTGVGRERVTNLHMGDPRFHDLVTDPESERSLRNRSRDYYSPPMSKRAQEAKTKKEKEDREIDRARLDELFHGKTVEDADTARRINRLLDQDYEQRNRQW